MSLAVFILPMGSLVNDLVSWKERIKNELPGQPYTSHPPHMTLINTELINEKDGVIAISAIISSIKPFQISVKRKNIFWDDSFTKGHTLFFEVEYNDALFELQKSLAIALKPFKKKVSPPNYLIEDNVILESFKTYGFPFIGRHWKPHFSVASLKTEKTDPIIKDFLSKTSQYNFTVDQFSIWNVNGDEHTQLKTLSFE